MNQALQDVIEHRRTTNVFGRNNRDILDILGISRMSRNGRSLGKRRGRSGFGGRHRRTNGCS